MDKSSTFFNRIKDSFEQTYQQGLPTDIWNNLSDKLKEEGLRSEENSLDRTEEQIRESFDTVHQQTAPNIWEQIATEIDDIPIDEALIKESFEESHQYEAPKEVWNSIEAKLHNQPQAEELIKDSFEQSFQAEVPAHLWAQIAKDFNAGNDTEELVKESFEENFSKQAPDYIWNAIRQQINIDGVWGRLAQVLDRWKAQARQRAVTQRIASIASLLLLMHACLPAFDYGTVGPVMPKQVSESHQPMAENYNQQEVTNSSTTAIPTQKEKMVIPRQHPPLTTHKFGTTSQERIQHLGRKTQAQHPSSKGNKVGTKTTTPSFSEQYQGLTLRLPLMLNNNTGSASPTKEDVKPSVSEQTQILAEQTPAKATKLLTEKDETAQNTTTSTTPGLTWLEAAVAEAIPQGSLLAQAPMLYSPPVEESTPKTNNAFKSKFEIGSILEAGVGFLWSDETFAGLQENSLLSTNFAPFLQYGAMLNWKFNKRSGLTAEVFAQSRIRQKIAYFSTAGYYETRMDALNYMRFSLLYQHQLFNYQPKPNITAGMLVRVGGYGAYLKNQANGNSRFQRFDTGLRFMLGHVHEWDRLSWEYGVATNWGLYNVLDGSFRLSNMQVNQTRLVNFGVHTSLRYTF